MKKTNINIISTDHTFNYLIEYRQNPIDSDIDYTGIKTTGLHRVDLTQGDDFIYYNNDWYNKDNWESFIGVDNITYVSDHLPQTYDKSTITLYFPLYGPEIFDDHILYMLNINTWVNGEYVYLGSKLINRYDALANDNMIKFDGHKYYESYTFDIIDPFDIQYGDNWQDFRVEVCGERQNSAEKTINNTGAQLNFSLYIVENDGNGYIKKTGYTGGQNSINISTGVQDYLSLNQSIDFDTECGIMIKEELSFNHIYDDIKDYMEETYNAKIAKIRYSLVIKDNENIYKGLDENGLENITIDDEELDISNPICFTTTNINFLDWSDWKDWENNWKTNVFISSSVTFYDDNGHEIFYLLGNEIPLTKDIYKYMIVEQPESPEIKYVNLKKVNMEIKNLNIVNKIENKIINLDRPNDSKSNIIQPIFFRTRDLNDLIIHPNITENICINLDAYKSKVEFFNIQIEDCIFKQIGTNGYGVIFKVIGKTLPNKSTSGIYYILDENSELVTTGKYTYEQ